MARGRPDGKRALARPDKVPCKDTLEARITGLGETQGSSGPLPPFDVARLRRAEVEVMTVEREDPKEAAELCPIASNHALEEWHAPEAPGFEVGGMQPAHLDEDIDRGDHLPLLEDCRR